MSRKKMGKNLKPKDLYIKSEKKVTLPKVRKTELKGKSLPGKSLPGMMLKKVFNPSSDKGEWQKHPSI